MGGKGTKGGKGAKGGKKGASNADASAKAPLRVELPESQEQLIEVEMFLSEFLGVTDRKGMAWGWRISLDPAPVPHASVVYPFPPTDLRVLTGPPDEAMVAEWIDKVGRKFSAYKKALTFQFGPRPCVFPAPETLLLPVLTKLGGEWADEWMPPRSVFAAHTTVAQRGLVAGVEGLQGSSGIPENPTTGLALWSVVPHEVPDEEWKLLFGESEGLITGASPSAMHSPGER